MGVRRRGFGLAAASVLLIATVGSAAAESDPNDITATAKGQEIATEAAARWAHAGIRTDTSAIVVVEEPDGTLTVMPRDMGPALIWNNDHGLGARVVVTGDASEREGRLTAEAGPLTALSPEAQPYASNCFARVSVTGGWMDTCYRLWKLYYETSSFDYWAIQAWASMDSDSPFLTDYAWIHVDIDAGPTPSWEDWDPGASWNSACHTQALGITLLGVGISGNFMACEGYTLTKYSAPGSLKLQYQGNSGATRELELMSAIKESGTGGPTWGISWNVKTCAPSYYVPCT
jgi:hypothetical protein